MEWIRENLFWFVLVAFFILMHARMHGGHGGHGSHGGGGHGRPGGGGGHGSSGQRDQAAGGQSHAQH